MGDRCTAAKPPHHPTYCLEDAAHQADITDLGIQISKDAKCRAMPFHVDGNTTLPPTSVGADSKFNGQLGKATNGRR